MKHAELDNVNSQSALRWHRKTSSTMCASLTVPVSSAMLHLTEDLHVDTDINLMLQKIFLSLAHVKMPWAGALTHASPFNFNSTI
eukprot:6150032-Amphidinium_carterae.2